jgi:NAD(P)-dependent dehydrogenase (short-subunit alcohol dehydrogenase family)
MGRALASHYVGQGARVTVVGSSAERGAAFLASADGDAAFVQADLRTVAENRRVIEDVRRRHSRLDGLVLTAMAAPVRRELTADGFESAFALYYVSRFVLSYGLTDLLEKGADPAIVSFGGTGMTAGEIHWDDLTLSRGFGMLKATLQAGRANDLLGVHYVRNHPAGRTRFVLDHPGWTDSGTNHTPQPMRTLLRVLGKLFAQSPERAVAPVVRLLDTPSAQRLIPWDRDKPVDPSLPSLDPANAQRLYELTKHVVEGEVRAA